MDIITTTRKTAGRSGFRLRPGAAGAGRRGGLAGRLGARLRRLRDGAAISQGEVARRTGLQASYLSKVENGVLLPGLENLDRIARAMGMDLAGVFERGRRHRPGRTRRQRG
ncbi:MAG TPA: helix-turn-helix transcriptional regulator [Bryobacterales bacterium]|nr:helix-turn-helix transcriptional regulator [Bryobacterales bacterium]